MKHRFYTLFVLFAVSGGLFLGGCGVDRNDTGIEYAPEMYHSMPLEPFTQIDGVKSPFKDGRNQQVPPEGTIARGSFAKFDLPADSSGIKASYTVKNPIPFSEDILNEGKVLYERFCAVCHGKKGKGNGSVAKHEAINPPAYNPEMPEGHIYHIIYHGQGVMGSHASQVTHEERWRIVHYVRSLADAGYKDRMMGIETPDSSKTGADAPDGEEGAEEDENGDGEENADGVEDADGEEDAVNLEQSNREEILQLLNDKG